ncbi:MULTISPECIES: hypothetical protein [unclassified Pseudofrankia]|uniref:hypothetical protein n=1 Tax=unclassified Pseudofrankia TaxID=2994372 RepID=UPI0012FF6B1D|nr:MULTISPECIES: hypothetical protein [unclassified Pseudofrankia]MDT3446507.1 hypothetical protein [Pseudofrankia sp. BMG5.37]
MQEHGEQGAIGGLELDPLAVELALQHGDLMSQREDLDVLVTVTAGQQAQQREGVGDTEVGQPKQHESASSRSRRSWRARARCWAIP